MGRVVVLVLLVMVVVVMLAVRSQSRSRCGGEPERRTQGLCGRSYTELLGSSTTGVDTIVHFGSVGRLQGLF